MAQPAPGQLLKRQCKKSGKRCSYLNRVLRKSFYIPLIFMRALIQRVISAKVSVEGETVAEIGHGLVILIGIGQGDSEEQSRFLAEKIATLRIFEDSDSKFNLSILDVCGSAIVVSQFTLYGDA